MIKVNDGYYLDRYRLEDEERLIVAINDPEIARTTLAVPHPYTSEDAKWWLQQCEQQFNCDEPQRQWTIRNQEGNVCGGIGLLNKYGPKSHKDELGYWLKQSLWNKGLMTETVKSFCRFCFEERSIIRLEAAVFDFNPSSAKVLVKSGFELEGKLQKALLKNGIYIDTLLYAKIAE